MFASRDDCKTKKMPKENVIVNISKKILASEMEKVRKGLLPLEMEDKWFIFCENNYIYFHRSWTGHCIYIAEYRELSNDDFEIFKLTINRNLEQYTQDDDDYDKELFNYLFDSLLLDKKVPFPSVNLGSEEENKLIKHVLVGNADSRKEIE